MDPAGSGREMPGHDAMRALNNMRLCDMSEWAYRRVGIRHCTFGVGMDFIRPIDTESRDLARHRKLAGAIGLWAAFCRLLSRIA